MYLKMEPNLSRLGAIKQPRMANTPTYTRPANTKAFWEAVRFM